MKDLERNFKQSLDKLNKVKPSKFHPDKQTLLQQQKDLKEKAQFYLETQNWDYQKALKEYKLDLKGQTVMELIQYNKKHSKKSQFKITEDGKIIKIKKEDKCTVF